MIPVVPALLSTTLWLSPSVLTDPQAPRGEGEWPLRPEPVVERAFDPPGSPWGAGHRGVDLLGAPAQVVHSALGGQVTFAGKLAGRGVVVVSHGATRTTYEPVAAIVRVGDLVAAGTPIGVLALAGSHCLPAACLHWGWLRGRTYLDPLDLVGAERVRLLPLDGVASVPAMPVARAGPAARTGGVLAGLTRAGALAGRPSGAGRW